MTEISSGTTKNKYFGLNMPNFGPFSPIWHLSGKIFENSQFSHNPPHFSARFGDISFEANISKFPRRHGNFELFASKLTSPKCAEKRGGLCDNCDFSKFWPESTKICKNVPKMGKIGPK